MEIRSELKYLHIAPRKVRSVVSLIRGMDVLRAEFQLSRISRRSAGPVLKLLRSAVANAVNNFGAKDGADLYIKKIAVDEGPVLKRMTPRAFGRSALIKKRMSHVRIVLDTKEGVKHLGDKKKKEVPTVRDATVQDIRDTAPAKERSEKEVRRVSVTRSKVPGFVRRIFRRKAI